MVSTIKRRKPKEVPKKLLPPPELAAAILELRRRKAIQKTADKLPSLAEFVKAAWHVAEGDNPLVWNWHLDAICLHLEVAFIGWLRASNKPWETAYSTLLDWVKGNCSESVITTINDWPDNSNQLFQNLLINVPPGSGKSRVFSVCFPAWAWLHYPRFRFLFLSANPRVALRDAVYCRDLIQSEWYQATFKPAWKLREDQNSKSSFWNTGGGIRNALGIESTVTGDRVDCIGVDDPHDALEVDSDTIRRNVLERWDSAIRNRVSDSRVSIRVGIMQRLHIDDWSAHVIKDGSWQVLKIPQEYEGGDSPLATGWSDPRTELGELMFEARFPSAVVEQEKHVLQKQYSGQHQQNPVPAEGNMINLSRFRRYDSLNDIPVPDLIIQSWDTAKKRKPGAAFWVGFTAYICGKDIYVIDVYRNRHNYPDGKKAVSDTIVRFHPNEVVIEDEATGTQLLQELPDGIPDGDKLFYPNLIAVDPREDKATRMSVELSAIEAGRVWIPRSKHPDFPWISELEIELSAFPESVYKDQVDTLSQLLMRVRTRVSTAKPMLFAFTNRNKIGNNQQNREAL